jgi:hypothetical protein
MSMPERDEVREVVDLVRRMPDRVRQFGAGPEVAGTEYGIGARLLAALEVAGLPRRAGTAGTEYDRSDLLNVALNLDIGSRPRRVLGWWARELERPYQGDARYRLGYVAGCPDPAHPGPCRYALCQPGGGRVVVVRSPHPAQPIHSVAVTLRRRWPPLSAALSDALDELRAIRFVRLPDPLRWDVDFMLHSRIGDCCAVAKYLTAAATRLGVPARMSYGRSLTPPFSSAHYWAELRVAETWVPLDPVLIDALVRWGLLAGRRWTRYDSLGGILARLASGPTAVARHNGRPVEVRLPVYHDGQPG